MRVKVFMQSIREGFIGIFRKYHCKDMILSLLFLTFIFDGMINANLVSVASTTRGSLVDRVESAVFDKKQAAEGDKGLKKIKIAALPKASTKSTYRKKHTASAPTITSITTAASSTSSVSATVKNTINIAGRSLPIFDVSSTAVDAGSSVAHIDHLYYGHRSTVFSFLAGLPVGTEFTINYGGASATYRIARTITLDNSIADASGATQASRLMPSLVAGNYQSVYDPASKTHIPAHYDAVLMTCAGASGKGISGRSSDAEARTVVLAKRI